MSLDQNGMKRVEDNILKIEAELTKRKKAMEEGYNAIRADMAKKDKKLAVQIKLLDTIKNNIPAIYEDKDVREVGALHRDTLKHFKETQSDSKLKQKLGDKEFQALLKKIESQVKRTSGLIPILIENSATQQKAGDPKLLEALTIDFLERQIFRVNWEISEQRERNQQKEKPVLDKESAVPLRNPFNGQMIVQSTPSGIIGNPSVNPFGQK